MYRFSLIFIIVILFYGCSGSNIIEEKPETLPVIDNTNIDEENGDNQNYAFSKKILALGDSYTIGQNVCPNCKFPEQLKDSLFSNIEDTFFDLKVIAQTGWTTTDLINSIESQDLKNNYNLVTLLIGVNNQFRDLPFANYEKEFPKLLDAAVKLAGGNRTYVIVVSIPDYAYTPFGENTPNPQKISTEIDKYNTFAKEHTTSRDITFINITDITRKGLDEPDLVASDGLHPSKIAYSKFIERILPKAIEKLAQ